MNLADLHILGLGALLRQGYVLNPDDATLPTLERIISEGQPVNCVVAIDDDARMISVLPSAVRAAA